MVHSMWETLCCEEGVHNSMHTQHECVFVAVKSGGL